MFPGGISSVGTSLPGVGFLGAKLPLFDFQRAMRKSWSEPPCRASPLLPSEARIVLMPFRPTARFYASGIRSSYELGLIDAQMSGATVIDVEGKSTSPD